MNYRCPNCREGLNVPRLFFSDITACKSCQQKVVLGDFLAFFLASVSMMVTALASLYTLLHKLGDNIVAGGYALSIGMVSGLSVLVLLGRAVPYKPIGFKRRTPATPAAPVKPAKTKT